MSTAKTITLKDIAKASGVSVMTVSRVLRKQANISPETQQKVQTVADKLGYRPNPMISALMTYRRAGRAERDYSTLGYITNFPTRDGWKHNNLYKQFFQGASESADRHGYRLEEFWLREPGMSSERLSKVLYYRNVSGIIVAPLPASHGHLRLDWDKFSAVTFGYSLAAPSLHRAVNHQFRSMALAMRQLRKLGYRRIGFAMSASFDSRVDHQWSGSFVVEQRRSPASDQVPLHIVEDKNWTAKNFAAWFCKHQPDVIISQQTEVLDWLREMGKRVPEDVGFVHTNCQDKSGEFAGIYQNGKVVGEVAVDFLVGMVQRNERGVPELAHSVLVDGTWVDGKTVRKQI